MRMNNTKRVLTAAALCMALPCAASAQGLPEFLDVVGEGMAQGVAQSAAMIAASMEEELGLAIAVSDARVEDGKTLTLTVTATNPRLTPTAVSFSLNVPERLACGGETQWEALLPAAAQNEAGEIVPGEAVFERTLALRPGGESEEVTLVCEMSMGPRFYRAQQALSLCVPDVRVAAQMDGGEDGRVEPGDVFVWRIAVENAGTAGKEVNIALVKPEAVDFEGELPPGFTLTGDRLTGSVHAQAAKEGDGAPSQAVIELPMRVAPDALMDDEDATRLLSGVLYADGLRVPLPRVQVCGAKISAQLLAPADALEAGEETVLRVVVMNEGLAAADVELSCVLPEGLTWMQEASGSKQKAEEKKEATPGEAVVSSAGGDGEGHYGVPVLAAAVGEEAMRLEGNALVYAWRMAAAQETQDGVQAATTVFEVPVRAETAQENLEEKLVGALVAYRVDGGQMQFAEPVAMRVYTPGFLGMTGKDWNGVFWAAVLMLITVSCLYGAVRASCEREEEYCCE